MGTSSIVRAACADDAAALTSLARAAKASWGYPAAWLDAWTEELTFDASYLAAHRVRVADRDGEPAGLLALERSPDGWEIAHLWVAPSAQRAGIGRLLLYDALAHVAETGGGPVWVLSDPYAEPFYVRAGAEHVDDVAAPMPGAPARTLPRLVFRDAAAAGAARSESQTPS